MTHFLLRASAINISKLIAKPSHEQIIQAEVSGQLSESWAHLSSYSAEHKKHTHTHSCLFISLLFLNPPPPRAVWWMEGMNSLRPPLVFLWGPQQLNKQHALNLKAQSRIYWNHVRFGYICVWSWSTCAITWKILFCAVVVSQNLDLFFYFFILKV